MRLIGILIISIIYALNAEELPKPTGFGEDLSALFDRDDSTLWVASDSLVSITVEPEGCFDRIVLVSSGEHERDVQRVVIHKDTASGWEITSNEVLPCSTDSSQEVRFKELVCADKVLLTFYSCTLQAVSLREMTFLNPLNQEKRALQACTTDAECATQIGLTCDGSNCVKTCISHPDCSDPLNPVCDFTTGNCAPGCATNQDFLIFLLHLIVIWMTPLPPAGRTNVSLVTVTTIASTRTNLSATAPMVLAFLSVPLITIVAPTQVRCTFAKCLPENANSLAEVA